MDTPIGGNNPFGERPLSARQPSNTAALLKALDELDDASHIPEGLIVDMPVWKRMCGLRREKVISEQEVSIMKCDILLIAVTSKLSIDIGCLPHIRHTSRQIPPPPEQNTGKELFLDML